MKTTRRELLQAFAAILALPSSRADGAFLVVASPPAAEGSTLTTLSLTNTVASARNNRVELFGQAFPRGQVPAGHKHIIWFDEEPPMDVYNEALIRTATLDGITLLTFTPLSGLSEVVMSFLPADQRPDLQT